jgi:hypothetical protein
MRAEMLIFPSFSREYWREVLIANYFSSEDINACLGFNINTLSSHGNFPAVKELFETFSENYAKESQ